MVCTIGVIIVILIIAFIMSRLRSSGIRRGGMFPPMGGGFGGGSFGGGGFGGGGGFSGGGGSFGGGGPAEGGDRPAVSITAYDVLSSSTRALRGALTIFTDR